MALALQAGVPAKAGVHIGECDLAASGGPILEISGIIAEAAAPGDVCVSRTVVDLVPGSGIEFEDRGSLRTRGKLPAIPILAVSSRKGSTQEEPSPV